MLLATEDNLEKLRADKRFEYVAISRKKNVGEVLFTGAAEQKIQMCHEKELTVEAVRYGEETLLR